MKINFSVFCVILLTSAFGQKQLPDCVLTKENWENKVGTVWPIESDSVKLIDLDSKREIPIIRWEITINFYPGGELQTVAVSDSDKKQVYFIEHISQDTYCVGKRKKSNQKIIRSYVSSLASPGKKFIRYWNLAITELTKFCTPCVVQE